MKTKVFLVRHGESEWIKHHTKYALCIYKY
jgi:bisphosphoglycerate-dependent phosphoglycerate mutase